MKHQLLQETAGTHLYLSTNVRLFHHSDIRLAQAAKHHLLLLLQDAMYAPYDAEIDFLQDQISVLSDEIAERDKHIECLKSERVAGGYEAAGPSGRGGSRASSMAPSDDGGADRDVELQVQTLLHTWKTAFPPSPPPRPHKGNPPPSPVFESRDLSPCDYKTCCHDCFI